MMDPKRLPRRALPALAAALAAPRVLPPAWAQPAAWPARTVRIVVPFPPGGSNDVVARPLAERLQARTGQSVVIENRPGASGAIGAGQVAAAPPDGTTLMVSSSSFATTSLVQRTSWDPERDFDAIALLARAPFVGIVHPDLPVRDWRGLAGLAKAKPGTINYGSSGAGGTNHFVTEYFSQAAGVEMNHVPYRGTAPAVLDLIAGRIQLMITTVASASAAMREGRVRVIGMADEGGGLPEGVAEPATARAQGFDFEASIWWGLIGPKGLPAEIRAAIHAAANLALADPALVRIYAAEGARPQQGGPDAFAQLLRSDLVRFREVARRANIRPE